MDFIAAFAQAGQEQNASMKYTASMAYIWLNIGCSKDPSWDEFRLKSEHRTIRSLEAHSGHHRQSISRIRSDEDQALLGALRRSDCRVQPCELDPAFLVCDDLLQESVAFWMAPDDAFLQKFRLDILFGFAAPPDGGQDPIQVELLLLCFHPSDDKLTDVSFILHLELTVVDLVQ